MQIPDAGGFEIEAVDFLDQLLGDRPVAITEAGRSVAVGHPAALSRTIGPAATARRPGLGLVDDAAGARVARGSGGGAGRADPQRARGVVGRRRARERAAL